MKNIQATAGAALLSGVLACFASPVLAQAAATAEQAAAPAPFKPFSLTGEWTFVNRESGTRFSGAVSVKVTEATSSGAMQGLASFDGRQTNDNCGTRGMFSDEPVKAEILKTDLGYDVSFNAKCSKGESPRPRKFKLTCENRICSAPTESPNGKGMVRLQEGS